jgi:TetR/AcrR family transcriptional repressor of nem operon
VAPRTDTKARILELARPMLQERGYAGFSYRDIADQLGVKKAAIHYHFPAKSDLGVALVDHMRRQFQRWSAAIDARDLSFWDRMHGFFGIYEHYIDDNKKCCPAGMLGAEFHAIPENLKTAAQALMSEVHGWLARTLEQGRTAGACSYPGEADEQAAVIGAAVQGALLVGRISGRQRFTDVVTQLERQMRID